MLLDIVLPDWIIALKDKHPQDVVEEAVEAEIEKHFLNITKEGFDKVIKECLEEMEYNERCE